MNDEQAISIAFHIGGPKPDVNQLLWSLRKNATELNEVGVMVRRPAIYLKPLQDLLKLQSDGALTTEDQQGFVSGLVKQHAVSRIVMSDPHFLGTGLDTISNGQLFSGAGQKVHALQQSFSTYPCSFYLGVCHPASLLLAAFQNQDKDDWKKFLGGTNLYSLRWSNVIKDIQKHAPDSPIFVWCVEDMTRSWHEVLSSVTGLGDTFQFDGHLDVLEEILPQKPYDVLKKYLAERPHLDIPQRREVIATFLDRFCTEEDTTVEIELPGYLQIEIDEMSRIYEDDLAQLAELSGLTFIS